MAEAQPLDFTAVARTNVSYASVVEQQLYRLNRGIWEQNVTGARWTGFHLISGQQRTRARNKRRPFTIANQWIDARFLPPSDFMRGAERTGLFFAAPKVTGSIFLAPTVVPSWVNLRLGINGQYRGATRAAVISAAFLLVFRAAQELDVDPEDFEVIEPRPYRLNGASVPVIQLCDALVNGSGLCNRLSQRVHTEVFAAELIESISSSGTDFPLKDFLNPEHADRCEQSCYECLQRYGNQPYHGLLDWRLGLDYLALLADARFAMHRPNASPALWSASWTGLREHLVNLLLRMTANPSRQDVDGISLVRIDAGADEWGAVTHPLWNWDDLIANLPSLAAFSDAHRVEPISTFDLARRPAGALDAARKRLAG
jgi:DEAD/DEAH box helicase domain-containing protein